jgi:hypothetical protein
MQSRKKPHAKLEQDEQRPVTVWEESAWKANADIPSRQEKTLNQDLDAIPFPYGNLPFDFIDTTSVSRRVGGRVSEVRRHLVAIIIILLGR